MKPSHAEECLGGGVADSEYEPNSASPEDSFKVLGNHTVVQQRLQQPFEARQEDPTVNGSVDERQAQSEAVQGYVNNLLGNDPIADLARNTGLINLTETLPDNERYTFIFQGNSQASDHILVSQGLATIAEYDIVHVNTEFAVPPSRPATTTPFSLASPSQPPT